MSKISLHIGLKSTGFLTTTIDNDYDRFHGNAEVSALG